MHFATFFVIMTALVIAFLGGRIYELHLKNAMDRKKTPFRWVCDSCKADGIKFELMSNDLISLDKMILRHKKQCEHKESI